MDLVAGQRQQIDAKLIDQRRNFAQALHRIGMHQSTPGMRQRRTRLHRLNGAYLIVGVHQCHELRVVGERMAEIIRIDQAPDPTGSRVIRNP